MASNGKTIDAAVPGAQDTIEVRPPVTQILLPRDADRKHKDYLYYTSIRWDKWWDEFSQSIDSKGRQEYRTFYSFAKKKAKNDHQLNLLLYMCGSQPDEDAQKKSKVPWLGDWERRRKSGFWSVEDPTQMLAIQKALKERHEGLEAVKSLAPVIAAQLERYHRLSQKIDEVYGGQPVLFDKSPNDAKNKARFDSYMAMQTACLQTIKDLMGMWMKIHAVPELDTQNWLKMAQIVAAGGAYGAAVGSHLGGAQSVAGALGASSPDSPVVTAQGPITMSHLLIAQSMAAKSDTYDLEMPVVEPVKSNGKSNGNSKVAH